MAGLSCVCDRDDRERQSRFITVEWIVEQHSWQGHATRIPRNKRVSVRIGYKASQRRLVKAAGGTWNPANKAWAVAYGEVVALGLTDRIVAGSVRHYLEHTE